MIEPGDTGEEDFDLDGAMDDIAVEITNKAEPIVEAAPVTPDVAPQTTPAREPPKSWAKEKHEHWAKLEPDAQDYIALRERQMLDGLEQYKGDSGFGKQMREAVAPFQDIIRQQGVDAATAVREMLNGHVRLSQGTLEERKAFLAQVAKNYGLDAPESPDMPPEIRALNERIEGLQAAMNGRARTEYEHAQAKVQTEVSAFAEQNPYFDEVADDIIAYLHAGLELKPAYEKAIWANPVTRQKEIARLSEESDAQRKEKAKAEAAAARKATSANVRHRDTAGSPTGPLGTMEDTMKDTLTEIRSRAH